MNKHTRIFFPYPFLPSSCNFEGKFHCSNWWAPAGVTHAFYAYSQRFILWSLNFLIDLFGLLLPVFLNSIQSYITWTASFPVNIKSCQNKAAMTMAATRSSEPSLRHNYPFSVRGCLLSLNCISSETNIRKITCLPLRGQSEGHFERHLTKSIWTEKTEQTQHTTLPCTSPYLNWRQLPSCSGCR